MIQARQDLLAALSAAVAEVHPDGAAAFVPAFESPRQAAHGDWAITAAMPLARALKKNPREIAAGIVAALGRQPAVTRWVDALEIAGAGFINLRLKPAARQAVVGEAITAGEAFGRAPVEGLQVGRAPAGGDRLLVEFVSANPTGPLHLGHARQAALGDAICRLFETQGCRVEREFYYNDAGVQIATLARSVQLRARGVAPGDPGWPTDPDDPTSKGFYNGEYIADIALDFIAKRTVRADDRAITASGNVDDQEAIRQFAVAYLRHEQDLDLKALGVRFDHYFLESSLYASGKVEATVAALVAAGKTYEDDGALWLRTTEYGDDKDRVMRKRDGTYTYFVPDVAYHLDKLGRGYARAINIQGGDHHGTIARVRAGVQAADPAVPPGFPDYLLHKMVTVMRGGQEVKLSKRAGSYVTLRDLIDWTGRDAVRFFLLSRKADTEFVFDVDLALKQSDENPVFYVQYAHARICSVIRQFEDAGGSTATLAGVELARLVAPSEAALMLKIADYPQVLANAAAGLAPHDLTFYLRELASTFHSYYAAERFLVDDATLAAARVALLLATRQVIRNALAVLGVSAPERMDRETLTSPIQTRLQTT